MRARLALSAALAIVLAANVAMAQSSSASGPHSIAPPMLPHLVKPGGSGGPVEPREAGIRCEQASAAKAGEAVSSPSQAAREKTAGSDAAVTRDASCPADRKPR
ncbi:MAG: hypothetical protein EXQ86_08465 [Rhodospirillales bacterium]|nr:hypothetical protein [Rhodospirillales bacterium]